LKVENEVEVRKMKRNTSAFTLIELLVVIAIIALMAAILFPVFAEAREDGRRTTCLNNSKNITMAILMYAHDSDDTVVPWLLPVAGKTRDSVRSDRLMWIDLLHPYIKNGLPLRKPDIPVNSRIPPTGIWNCPSFNEAKFVDSMNRVDCGGPGDIDLVDVARQYYAHYAVVFPNPAGSLGSCTEADPHFNYPGSDPLFFLVTGTLAQIQRPAETVIMSDGVTAMLNFPNWAIYMSWGCSAAQSHHGGGNHGFADGHIRFFKGNSENILDKDSTGCYYKRYYSIDR
jgi:prepilin-type N-terminal cleavage/methylation domain-containing protein